MTTTTQSLFRAALGPAFDRLAPVLQRHYDLLPGQEVVIEGRMDAWNRYPFARAVIPFMPVPGVGIPVRVLNRGLLDAGEVCYEWKREFQNPNGTAMSYTLTRPAPPAGHLPCVLDTFNQPPNIGVTLGLEVLEDGKVLKQVNAGPQYALNNGRRIALPTPFQVNSIAIERAMDDRTLHTEVVISHAIFGKMFGYSGTLMLI
jgi:hypothetical protein